MSLVDRALQRNLDLRQASARVREARARRGIIAAERFPTLDASGAVTPTRSVETRSEREKLMFRVKVMIPRELVIKHIEKVKTGVRGVAYVRLDDSVAWPAALERRFAGDPS